MADKREFLPVSQEDMEKRGWKECDFILVSADAYVDHPSFAAAIISRVLEKNGYRVGIIAQPDYNNPESVTVLGKPKYGFLVSGGNMDTMVSHYTVAKNKRTYDYYSPGGKMGYRPDRATIVYTKMIRRKYGNIPIIIGGIEASLRRMAHYDYWSDRVMKSILIDSNADIISYGMGEKSIVEIADCLQGGLDIKDITFVRGTVYKTKNIDNVTDYIMLPSFENILNDKKKFAESFYIQYCNTSPQNSKTLIEPYANMYIVQNIPAEPLTTREMDSVYSLKYVGDYHPMYEEQGGIPAIKEVKFSVISGRGCFGGCSFCALTFHQGRTVQTRSHESIIAEATRLTWDKDFKGYINDISAPTANFRKPSCQKQLEHGVCKKRQCLFPKPCPNMEVDHSDFISLLRKMRQIPGVKKVFIRSGIRFDYLLADPKCDSLIKELCEHHISGQLKVAPEHVSDNVLRHMGKPRVNVYNEFVEKYRKANQQLGKPQYVVPYLMSSHPGSTLKDAIALAEYLREIKYSPEQVQDFYPTPSTISTCMYYTGYDPRTMEPVYVARSSGEKAMQRALIQFRNPKNYDLVHKALCLAGREDLIGTGPKCLIREKYVKSSSRPSGAGGRGRSKLR
ncbi:MAG: YgiQ family radical SAM protein [Ruminococcaceae bacterium]|nr:YgiQ family radical SAM protein [Oscillospiraceae bacterium]